MLFQTTIKIAYFEPNEGAEWRWSHVIARKFDLYNYCEQVNARLSIALRSSAPLRNATHALARYCEPGLMVVFRIHGHIIISHSTVVLCI